MTTETAQIQANVIADAQRLDALPGHFGPHFFTVEQTIYKMMGALCPSYQGGYWEFFHLDNGGFYMAPRPLPDRIRVEIGGNGFSAEVSNDAAGIITCLFALCAVAERTQSDLIIDRYHELRNFAMQAHPEASLIAQAID